MQSQRAVVRKLLRRSPCMREMATNKAATTFAGVQMALPDHMNLLKKEYDNDPRASKVDLGAGVLRNEEGGCYEFPAIQRAKRTLEQRGLGHDYRPTTGISSFRDNAAKVMFGEDSPLLKEGRITSVQTVAGTGACRIGAVFLSKNWPSTPSNPLSISSSNPTSVHVANPTWPNYEPLFRHAGFPNVQTFRYLSTGYDIDFEATLAELETATTASIFIFQGCCNNPTGRDYTRAQWEQIAASMLRKQHFAFFDTAYQGLGTGIDDDAWAVRHFAEKGVDMLVAQSFSKNAGLYAERVGVLHVVCPNRLIASNVLDQLRALIRWEVSSAPAYGAELVNTVLDNPEEKQAWINELGEARARTQRLRQHLHTLLTEKYATPSPRDCTTSGWNHLLEERGLFSFTGMSAAQSRALIDEHQIYVPANGRINISGLNDMNIDRVAAAFSKILLVR